jgi:hypothetical protein
MQPEAVRLVSVLTTPPEHADSFVAPEPSAETVGRYYNRGCRPIDRLWVQADYLHWWLQGYSVPPLVTTAPALVGQFPGALTDPNATVVFGDRSLNGEGRSGVRVRLGYWFDCCRQCGVQFEYFGLEGGGSTFVAESSPGTFVFRPFYNADPAVVAMDAQLADRVSIGSSSTVYSPAALLRCNLWCCADEATCRSCFLDVIAGYRHFHLGEQLTISETASFPPATTFNLVDRFVTENQFHGGEIGLIGQIYRGPWKLEGIARVALGNNHETVHIDGYGTTTTPPGAPLPLRGGLLTQPSNIGQVSQDHFAAIPSFELMLSRCVGRNLRVSVGYTFMWLSHAVRPGDQIDFAVDGRWLDPNFVPPGTPPALRPAGRFVSSSPWVQGVNIGVEWNY